MKIYNKNHIITLSVLLVSTIIIACSIEPSTSFPSSNIPTPVDPDIKYTQAIFKTNYSGSYIVNQDAYLDLGIYDIDFSEGYQIITSALDDEIFIFNIEYTNNIKTKGIQKITFTNGRWDNVGNFQMLEILNTQEASLHNLLLVLIEEPDKIYSWREKIKADNTNLYFMGTNIATKN